MPHNKNKIKILIAKPGLDGHDRGAKVVAQALKDAGMEVIYSGLHKTIDQIINIAIQEDVDFIGLSIMTGAHIPITEKLMKKLKEKGIEDKKVFVGGVIPSKDIPKLKELGVEGVFPGGTPLQETIEFIKNKTKTP
ncbi:MAG TPA: cobalamin B12-binding domain-containing protein [Syntrophorhabdaceae bacterium]|nr:cobalamin B12-binding domain-containing protein [Syntrophorhabdaceae bacterium]HPU29455.1 cobalamin B12-binding domain-containing protein [Syntrophorhabdaceae bacterium]